jgi:hypothetical protein
MEHFGEVTPPVAIFILRRTAYGVNVIMEFGIQPRSVDVTEERPGWSWPASVPINPALMMPF